ncbi:alkaline phosphatase D family protein [Umezawaea endophytica]|uniref:Alkaline phosphatase D family protein n=1 Tax=Umezawaea endophytica TaxID=1654476 RepID=A0A9X2VRQ4_9PSEU|nr:alkaline phosphatase D family protein [Umezawaea endophytica]MCS7481505.1 alkaline phosphatase D family protein [Umezawaea endophytica]
MSEFVLNRRQALVGVAAAVGTALVGAPAASASAEAPVFTLGVASGDPLPDGVVLWTRLIVEADRAIPVGWQVAEDELFRRVVRSGVALARPELAHSVHVDVRGLRPGRVYFYRFRAGADLSPVGRTKTAGCDERLRLGVVSCQDFQNGYWPAYLGLSDEDLDVVLHLGDYIYENEPGSVFADRVHTMPETPGLGQLRTLADYRARHAQYKSDPALRAAHAAHPFVSTWDDHEVESNYANLVDEADDTGAAHQTPEEFAVQRAAGYQAYYEHMPIRATLVPGSSGLRIYRRFDFGSLVRVNVLDTRQYRTDQPGGFPSDIGLEGPGVGNVSGTLTGAEQEAWLTAGLVESPARWNVVAQQVMMARTRLPNPIPPHVPPTVVNLDQWDGYQPQRERLLRFVAEAGVVNPVFLAGDIHSTWVNELKTDFDDVAAAPVAAEFVGTSISSSFPVAFDGPIKAANPTLNPHVRYFDGLKHGYLRCEVDRDRWRTDVRVVDTIDVREAPVATAASFVVEAGSSVIHRV